MSTAVLVTIPAATVAAEADADARQARRLDAEAQGYLTAARELVPHVPAMFRTPGGSTAAEVLALIEHDAAEVRAASMSATACAAAARDADNVPDALHEADMARVYRVSARYDTASIVRLLGYFPS